MFLFLENFTFKDIDVGSQSESQKIIKSNKPVFKHFKRLNFGYRKNINHVLHIAVRTSNQHIIKLT